MYYLVNRMSATPDTLGMILSVHRSADAARAAAVICQPKQRGSYLPVAIIASAARYSPHTFFPIVGTWSFIPFYGEEA